MVTNMKTQKMNTVKTCNDCGCEFCANCGEEIRYVALESVNSLVLAHATGMNHESLCELVNEIVSDMGVEDEQGGGALQNGVTGQEIEFIHMSADVYGEVIPVLRAMELDDGTNYLREMDEPVASQQMRVFLSDPVNQEAICS